MRSSTAPANAAASHHLNLTEFEPMIRDVLALAAVEFVSVCQRFRAVAPALPTDQAALRASNAFNFSAAPKFKFRTAFRQRLACIEPCRTLQVIASSNIIVVMIGYERRMKVPIDGI
jgi:hypothetical protein